MNTSFQNLLPPRLPKGFELFMNIRLILGFYYDGKFSRPMSITLRIYCFIFAAFVVSVFFIFYPFNYNTPRMYSYIDYFLSIVLCIVLEEKYYVDYFSNLINIDMILKFKASVVSTDLLKIFILLFGVRTAIVILHITTEFEMVHSLSLVFIALAVILKFIPILMVFDALYQRMRFMRVIFETKIFGSHLTLAQDPKDIKIVYIRRCLLVYDKLYKNLHRNYFGFHAMIFLPLVLNVPEVVFMLYNLIKTIIYNGEMLTVIYIFSWLSFSLSLLCLPGYYFERLIAETEKIKLMLMDYTIRSTDLELLEVIHLTLTCISARPFKYNIFRIIPVNGYLPLGYISLCITYVIVAVQFKKFKD